MIAYTPVFLQHHFASGIHPPTNAWLRQYPWYPGSYPSGGPVRGAEGPVLAFRPRVIYFAGTSFAVISAIQPPAGSAFSTTFLSPFSRIIVA